MKRRWSYEYGSMLIHVLCYKLLLSWLETCKGRVNDLWENGNILTLRYCKQCHLCHPYCIFIVEFFFILNCSGNICSFHNVSALGLLAFLVISFSVILFYFQLLFLHKNHIKLSYHLSSIHWTKNDCIWYIPQIICIFVIECPWYVVVIPAHHIVTIIYRNEAKIK